MRFRFVFLFVFITACTIYPTVASASAAIPFFGPIIPQDANQNACPAGWGMLIVVINNIIRFLITLAIVFVAPLTIAWAGFLYVVNPVSPNEVSKAKTILWNTILGLVLALSGWLIVNAIMAVLYHPTDPRLAGKKWSELITSGGQSPCLSQAGARPGDGLSQAAGPSVGTGGGSGVGACTAPTSGPCAVANLQNTCFGSNAGVAAQICSRESANNPNAPSSSDITADGKPYSVGLFQINLTNSFSQKVGNQNCSEAFSAPCQGSAVTQSGANIGRCTSTVVNMSLYNQCVEIAKDQAKSITEACRLSGNGSNWNPWRTSALACGIILR